MTVSRPALFFRCAALCLLVWLIAQPAFGATPSRIITLAPHITELVFAAGAGDKIVGTVSSSNYPAGAKKLPKIGDGASSINTETLVRLAPDLVLAWHESGAVAHIQPLLQRLGIRLEYINPSSLDDIPRQIRRLGKELGTSPAANASAQRLEYQLHQLSASPSSAAAQAPIPVLIEVGQAPLYAAGNDPMLNDALHRCGATNIYGDSALAALPVSPEDVLHRRPKLILVASNTPAQEKSALQYWRRLSSHTTPLRVVGIDPDSFFRPGPRLIAATRNLCRLLAQQTP